VCLLQVIALVAAPFMMEDPEVVKHFPKVIIKYYFITHIFDQYAVCT
jgi:hypothetical protein